MRHLVVQIRLPRNAQRQLLGRADQGSEAGSPKEISRNKEFVCILPQRQSHERDVHLTISVIEGIGDWI
ncbi:uncharacterized protein ARMOST_22443 [Armillaria ostoyae]|uniref:Uncharacterized protein n=1 Tax=Armillaria ostoyae TaxID=47428 RepID=A0A284SCW3_ARMOS|nr:uncharacterized protein ARMOST_22443 [Armillaria ostoyae]